MKSIGILCISGFLMVLYLIDFKKNKLDLKTMVITSVFSAISFVLYLFHIIQYPQGGGITLFSMMPVMLLSLMYGRTAGLTGGLVFGFLKLLHGAYVINPAQFLLDYTLSTMALGLADTFGHTIKWKMIGGCLFAVSISVGISVLSGVLYFGQYAPEGMNVFWYSMAYNCSSAGVEGLLSTALISLMSLERLKGLAKVA